LFKKENYYYKKQLNPPKDATKKGKEQESNQLQREGTAPRF